MKIICVGGSESSIGKTSVCEMILKNFRGFCALKVTTIRYNKNHPDIMDNFHRGTALPECDYEIDDNEKSLSETGKDTQRMLSAGASKVLWLKATPDSVKQGLQESLNRFPQCEGVVVEGNTPMLYIEDSIRIFIIGSGKIIKRSAEQVLEKVDILLGNSEDIKKFEKSYRTLSAKVFEYPFSSGMSDFMAYLQELVGKKNCR